MKQIRYVYPSIKTKIVVPRTKLLGDGAEFDHPIAHTIVCTMEDEEGCMMGHE